MRHASSNANLPSPFLICSLRPLTSTRMLCLLDIWLIVSKFDTTNATRYVDIITDVSNSSTSHSLVFLFKRDLISYLINKALKCVTHESFRVFCVVRINGMLDNELVKFLCLIMNNLKEAFMAGSSKQGNARRASVGSNWVVAMLRNKTKRKKGF